MWNLIRSFTTNLRNTNSPPLSMLQVSAVNHPHKNLFWSIIGSMCWREIIDLWIKSRKHTTPKVFTCDKEKCKYVLIICSNHLCRTLSTSRHNNSILSSEVHGGSMWSVICCYYGHGWVNTLTSSKQAKKTHTQIIWQCQSI